MSTLLPHLQKFSKCPICGDPVYARDLKAVKWWDARSAERRFAHAVQPDAGKDTALSSDSRSKDEYLTLRLIERPQQDASSSTPLTTHRSTTFLSAANSEDPDFSDSAIVKKGHRQAHRKSSSTSATPRSSNSAPWHFLPDVMTFAKFMLATPPYLLSSMSENLSELAVERALLDGSMPGSGGAVDNLGLVFVETAASKVQEQMEKVRTELDTQWVRTGISRARAETSTLQGQLRDQAEVDHSRAQIVRRDRAAKHTAACEEATGELHLGSTQTEEAVEAFPATRPTPSSFLTTPTAADDKTMSTGTKSQTGREGRTRKNLNPLAPNAPSSLFYQAASGQNIFLQAWRPAAAARANLWTLIFFAWGHGPGATIDNITYSSRAKS